MVLIRKRERYMPDSGRGRASAGRRRELGALTALALAAALAAAPAALASRDPVASGSFSLTLSRGFKKQLARSGVLMTRTALPIRTGAIDPIAGSGSLALGGKLRFKRAGKFVAFTNLSAELGPGGVLIGKKARGHRVQLFGLRGGTVAREGFGAKISGVEASLLPSAVKQVRAGLLRDRANQARPKLALRAGLAGSLAVSVKPQTVEVTGGEMQITPGLPTSAGTVASKLSNHCINLFPDGVLAGLPSGPQGVAPATQDSFTIGPGPTLTGSGTLHLPVTGGTISPVGTAGVINQAGGSTLTSTSDSLFGLFGCTTTNTVRQTDFSTDLLRGTASAHVVVSGPPAPLGGDHGTVVTENLDISNATVSADPAAHTVTVSGIKVTINKASALDLNQTFQQPIYNIFHQPINPDPNMELIAGDVIGVATLSATVR
jgi:hypothetical protein